MRRLLLTLLLAGAVTAAGAASALQSSQVIVASGGVVRALAGEVTDASGATIPDVVVSRLAGDGKTVAETTHTDAQGHFSLAPAADGRYTLRFDAKGFTELEMHLSVNHRLHRMIHASLQYGG